MNEKKLESVESTRFPEWAPDGFHRLGEGLFADVSSVDVLHRLYEATGTSSRRELATWLNIRVSWLARAQRENIVPVNWLRTLLLKGSNYNPAWILTGKGLKQWAALTDTRVLTEPEAGHAFLQ
jgi:Bacteriophage CI repressor helix-turn-helix domain.